MAGLSLGAGIIVSALTTRYRDLQQLVVFGVQLMMYATPVVYPLSMIGGGSFRWLILANPMTPIVETFRYAFLGSGTLDGIYLCYSAGFTLAVLFTGIVLFNHVERTFMTRFSRITRQLPQAPSPSSTLWIGTFRKQRSF